MTTHALGGAVHPLLPTLHKIQNEHGYIPPELVQEEAEKIGLNPTHVWEAIKFYHYFHTAPLGRFSIRVPMCPANVVAGIESVHDALTQQLGISYEDQPDGVYTTPDGLISYEPVSCCGRDYMAPYLLVNDVPVPLDKRNPAAHARTLLDMVLQGRFVDTALPMPEVKVTEMHHRALKGILSMTADEILERIEQSGLRGRGGAAFLAGKKWRTARENVQCLLGKGTQETGDLAYVVGNHDEGEPCTFKDEDLSLADAPRVLIGMIACGRVIGATRGVVYVRYEYPHVFAAYERAIAQMLDAGLLGRNILNTGQDFFMEVVRGGGSYPTGESSGLVRSVMGKLRPRKTQRLSVSGLWNKPTVVGNIESFASAADILELGPTMWIENGRLRRFSVSGCVVNPGVYVLPEQTTIHTLIEAAGGATEPLWGAIPGGASTAFVADLDTVAAGTGAVTVIGKHVDLARLAHWISWFFWRESCGGCLACPSVTQALVDCTNDVDTFLAPCTQTKLEALHIAAQAGQCGMLWPAVEPILALLHALEEIDHAK